MKINHFFLAVIFVAMALMLSACGPDPCIGRGCGDDSNASKQQSTSYSLVCSGLPTIGAVDITITKPTVTCNGTAVLDAVLTWTPSTFNWTAPVAGTYNISVTSGYGDCNGETASCGTLTVSVPPSKGNDIANYRTVPIGDQVWMAENLDYDVSGSKCYNDIKSNCTKYGRLYDWATAMALPSGCNSGSCSSLLDAKHRGICPEGWHIPSDTEWTTLTDFVGGSLTAGKYLKSTSGWCNSTGGQDTYGFAALPGGSSGTGFIDRVYIYGDWWTATEIDANSAYYRQMYCHDDKVSSSKQYKDYELYSVRCLKD